MSHFVYSSSSLPPIKTDYTSLPARIPTGSAITSAEFNQLVQALYDTRDVHLSGALHGFQRSLLAPTGSAGPAVSSAEFLWVDMSGNLTLYLNNGINRVVSSPTGHIIGSGSSSPSGTLGGGAGSGGSYTISGSDSAHLLTVAVGTATVAAVPLITGTFGSSYGRAPNGIQLAPANAAAAGLTGSYEVYVDSNAVFRLVGTSYVIMVGPAQLPPSTTYKWWVNVTG